MLFFGIGEKGGVLRVVKELPSLRISVRKKESSKRQLYVSFQYMKVTPSIDTVIETFL